MRSARRKILVVALNFPPELTGIGKYVGEMVDWLHADGVEVRVVTAPPYYPAWAIGDGYSAWQYRRERVRGVRVYRCPLYVPRSPSGLKRVLHLLTFAASTLPVVLWHGVFWRPESVFVVEPPLACAPATLLAARLGGSRAWLHVQDFEVDAAFDLGILAPGPLRSMALSIERWLMRRFDRVSTISTSMLARLTAKGVGQSRSYLFPNWVDFSSIVPIVGPNALRSEFGLRDDQKVLLYSGNLGAKQGLEVLVELARRLIDQQDVLMLVCGDGPGRTLVEEGTRGLPNVRLLPLQPRERLNELLQLAAVHLLPQRADAEDLVMPSKLTSMMASGRPVVATARPGSEVGQLLDGVGRLVPPGDAPAFARAVLLLVRDPVTSATLGESARRRAIELWDRERVLRGAFADPSLSRK